MQCCMLWTRVLLITHANLYAISDTQAVLSDVARAQRYFPCLCQAPIDWRSKAGRGCYLVHVVVLVIDALVDRRKPRRPHSPAPMSGHEPILFLLLPHMLALGHCSWAASTTDVLHNCVHLELAASARTRLNAAYDGQRTVSAQVRARVRIRTRDLKLRIVNDKCMIVGRCLCVVRVRARLVQLDIERSCSHQQRRRFHIHECRHTDVASSRLPVSTVIGALTKVASALRI